IRRLGTVCVSFVLELLVSFVIRPNHSDLDPRWIRCQCRLITPASPGSAGVLAGAFREFRLTGWRGRRRSQGFIQAPFAFELATVVRNADGLSIHEILVNHVR